MNNVLPSLINALQCWLRRLRKVDDVVEAAFRTVASVQSKEKDQEVSISCLNFYLELISPDATGATSFLAPYILKGLSFFFHFVCGLPSNIPPFL